MRIKGNRIELTPAQESDRKKIYTWLTQSNLTSSMMGPPEYSDHPIPTLEEFCKDYTLSFFNTSGDGRGRNYIIVVDGEEIGTIGYDLLDKNKNRAVLDIWMSDEKHCGHGYGSDALDALCHYIYKTYDISNFIICPSARNKRAIAAYNKAGFKFVDYISKEEQEKEFGISEFDDNMLMVKNLGKK